jgi:hemerythrin-like domain-containing protein
MNTHAIPGFHSPSASTEAPLEMLSACHGRVERQCQTLQRLVAHLQANGADEAAQSAAGAVMRYFDTAARDHHADEEQDLFPALLEAVAGSDAVCLQALVQGLTDEHRQMEQQWSALREVLQPLSEGQATTLSAAAVERFVQAYASHIEREETELLPTAARLLGDADLARLGRAMRERRGIPPVD